MNRLTLTATAQLVSFVMLGLSSLLLVVAIIYDPSSWLYVIAAAVVIVSSGYSLVTQRSSIRTHQRIGSWDERVFVIESIREAKQRGLTADEWVDGYCERVLFDGYATGVLSPPNEEPPDGSHEALP